MANLAQYGDTMVSVDVNLLVKSGLYIFKVRKKSRNVSYRTALGKISIKNKKLNTNGLELNLAVI